MPEQVKVDFRTLKNSVPIASVLEKYGVTLRGNGGQLSLNCPLPTHNSKDSRFSFKVNVNANVWCCKSHSCVEGYQKSLFGKRGGDCIDFVAVMENTDTLGAAKKLLEWFPQNGEPKSPSNQAKPNGHTDCQPPKNGLSTNETPIVNKVLGFELKGITYHPYLKARGISEELAQSFGVGFFPGKGSMSGRVVIPIRDDAGALVAYAGRSINGEEPKYKLPVGFHKSLVLYNRHTVKGEAVTIVEGFFGAMKVTEARFPCVGLIGCTLSEAQESLLRTFKFITLFLDPDEAGRAGTKEIALRLAHNHYVRIARNEKPPDEMTPEEIGNTLRYVCPLSPSTPAQK